MAVKAHDRSKMGNYYEQFIPEPVWPSIPKGKTYHWKMVSVFPSHFPILGENIDRFARVVKEKSKGRLIISVYGGGELIPPLKVFDAVSQGIAEAGGSISSYWAGKTPAAHFFATVPFGMNTQGMLQWLHHHGGLKLWEEVYDKFNIIPRPAGTMDYQMGGWFNKEINSASDLQGIKMRITGLGGKIFAKAGGKIILIPGGEIFSSLDRGVIDAAEWAGPYHDQQMGFYKTAKYYYSPGWHEPGTNLEFIFNRNAYRELPDELQQLIDQASLDCELWVIKKFVKKNHQAFKELLKHGVQVKRFPDSVLHKLEQLSKKILLNAASKDILFKRVYKHYLEVQNILGNSAVSHDNAYYSK